MRIALIAVAAAASVALVAANLAAAPSASSADGATPVTAFAASLAPGGERPASKGTRAGAGGLFRAIVTRTGGKASISWSLSFAKLTGPALAAHIHLGKPGTAGKVVVPLCQPCRSGQRGDAALSGSVAAALANGGAYVNVHTKANPGGEIRGQVGTAHTLAAGLQASAETPLPQGVPDGAGGVFTAIVIDLSPRPLILWSLSFNGLSGPASASHIHLGKAGVAGPVVLALCGPCSSPLTGHKAIDANLAAAISSGGAYVNVHTAANPGGEVRGQLVRATLGVAALTSKLGSILVDDRGFTLYDFVADRGTQSACYGRCAGFWPPAYTYGSPIAAVGTKAPLVSVASRTDGTTMLVYNGHPVYGFQPDASPGDAKGQGSTAFGAAWWVLDAATGAEITAKP
jgi:predicted lipoprotein with Yx(FWY)xxD motif